MQEARSTGIMYIILQYKFYYVSAIYIYICLLILLFIILYYIIADTNGELLGSPCTSQISCTRHPQRVTEERCMYHHIIKCTCYVG